MGEEKNFENKVKDFLKEEGAWFVKYWSGNAMNGKKFTRDGVPDILACINGRFVGIEIKASSGKASELQLHNLKKINESGGYAILLYPDQWTLFKNFILCLNSGDHVNTYKNYELLKERWKN